MTWLITHSFTFLHICLMSSEAILFPPMNLTVNLLDLMVTAEWMPGPENPPGTRYTLEFIPAQSISGGKWNPSPTCSDIATLKCDLTFDQQLEELFWSYFVRVKATFKGTSSNWTTTSKSFQPYGDTRLSSPVVKISTERHTITIYFSHRLELNQGIKPLEFLICLFENDSVGLNSKFVALASTSKSPHIFSDVPHGKNYCINVSASHQQAMRKNNFNTTECFFLSDSSRSPSGVIVFIVAMVAIAVGVTLTSMYFYQKRFKMEDIPKSLFDFTGTKTMLNFFLPENMNVSSLIWSSNAVTNTEECDSSPEENNSLLYHPREGSLSVVKQEPAIHLPDPVEEAEPLNRNLSDYRLATDMEENGENVISEDDEGNTHLGDTVAFTSTSNLSLCTESEPPQLHTVSIRLDRKAEEIDNGCDEEEDFSFCDDSFSDADYEPRFFKMDGFHEV